MNINNGLPVEKIISLKGEVYNPNARNTRLESLDLERRAIANKISMKQESLNNLKKIANLLLGKGTKRTIVERTRVLEGIAPFTKIVLTYEVPDFVPKNPILEIQQADRLAVSPLSRVQFFKLIRKLKDDIKALNKEYSKLSKQYDELKNNPIALREDLQELKAKKLKEIAEIDKYLSENC